MRGKTPTELDIFGVKFTFAPLPFRDSSPMVPEIGEIVSTAMREFGSLLTSGSIRMDDDVVKLLPALSPIFSFFGNGRLERLGPKLLASTTAIADLGDGQGKQRLELMKTDDRDLLFDAYPECYIPAVFMAGKVTFSRFFPASVLRELSKRAAARKATGSTPTDSNPSTSRDQAGTG